MFLIILIKSLIIGGLVGVGVGAGAARMFHAPTTQGMGAFRTLGELNSCEGDPASHFSFGLGFFFNAWASSVAAGSFTQDVDHRIIPNWGAAALMLKNRNVGETLHDPKKMAIACGIIGKGGNTRKQSKQNKRRHRYGKQFFECVFHKNHILSFLLFSNCII